MRSSGRVRPTMAPLGFHALGDTVGGSSGARRNGSYLPLEGQKRGIIWRILTSSTTF